MGHGAGHRGLMSMGMGTHAYGGYARACALMIAWLHGCMELSSSGILIIYMGAMSQDGLDTCKVRGVSCTFPTIEILSTIENLSHHRAIMYYTCCHLKFENWY